jgi:hypothetical protein
MKYLVGLMALAASMMTLTGCETLADTAAENRVRVSHAVIMDLRQIPGDLEYIFYLDRPVWMSRYPIPND